MHDDANAKKEQIAGLYNRAAPVYGSIGPDFFAYFGRRLVEVLDMPPGAQVLDVGTGRGANLFPAAQKVGASGHVTGIDIAEKMVQETVADIKRRGVQNATIYQMDAENLTFPDEAFDYVLCSFAYFFFPNLKHALAEFYRVLRPHGKVAVNLTGGNDPGWQWYEKLLVEYHKIHHFALSVGGGKGHWDPTDFKELLTSTGFADIQLIPEEHEFIYADEQEFWASRWTHGTRYSLENMPPEVLDRFHAEVLSRIVPLKQPDGFHERWRQLYAIGTKPGR